MPIQVPIHIQWLNLIGLVVILLAFVSIFFFIVRTALVVVTVQYTSMSPTLEDGDRVLVWRYWPARWLRKGQVVIVWPWLSASTSWRLMRQSEVVPFIKRVIALP